MGACHSAIERSGQAQQADTRNRPPAAGPEAARNRYVFSPPPVSRWRKRVAVTASSLSCPPHVSARQGAIPSAADRSVAARPGAVSSPNFADRNFFFARKQHAEILCEFANSARTARRGAPAESRGGGAKPAWTGAPRGTTRNPIRSRRSPRRRRPPRPAFGAAGAHFLGARASPPARIRRARCRRWKRVHPSATSRRAKTCGRDARAPREAGARRARELRRVRRSGRRCCDLRGRTPRRRAIRARRNGGTCRRTPSPGAGPTRRRAAHPSRPS